MVYNQNPDHIPLRAPPPHDSDFGQFSGDPTGASHVGESGYWVAPDGTRHPLTPQQIQQMLAQTTAQKQTPMSKEPVYEKIPPPIHAYSHAATQQPGLEVAPTEQPGLEPVDQEMLAEAQGLEVHNQSAPESEKQEDAALDESLAWIPKFEGRPNQGRSHAPLAVCFTVLLKLIRLQR